MSRRIECPKCSAGVKVSDNFPKGRAIRCPKCRDTFTPLPRNNDAARANGSGTPVESSGHSHSVAVASKPRRKRKTKSARSAVLFWFTLGAGAAISIVAAVFGVAAILKRGEPLETRPKPSDEVVVSLPEVPVHGTPSTAGDLGKLTAGMFPAEAELALGPGQEISIERARASFQEVNARVPLQAWFNLSKKTEKWILWGNQAGAIYGGFARTKQGDVRLTMSFLALKQDGKLEYVPGVSETVEKLERRDQEIAKRTEFEKDPKWSNGPKIRELAVGAWKRPYPGTNEFAILELKPDGSAHSDKQLLLNMRGVKAYRFRDDLTIEIDAPDLAAKLAIKAHPYRVFVNETELWLLDLNAPLPVWDGPYHRGR